MGINLGVEVIGVVVRPFDEVSVIGAVVGMELSATEGLEVIGGAVIGEAAIGKLVGLTVVNNPVGASVKGAAVLRAKVGAEDVFFVMGARVGECLLGGVVAGEVVIG